MKNKIKVFVVGGDTDYANFLLMEYELVKSIKEADIAIFTGGEDVYPMLYGEETGSRTYYNSQRDYDEIDKFEEARYYNVLAVGICRGSQFLTTRAGGKLIQHVENHAIRGTHKIFIPSECREIDITSTHHQMMWPFNLRNEQYKIIAHTKCNLSNTYLDGWDKNKKLPDNFVEPEIVYYHNINALCVQGHPEYMDKSSQAIKFINLLIEELLEDNIKRDTADEEDELNAPIIVNNNRFLLNEAFNAKIKVPEAPIKLGDYLLNDFQPLIR